MRFLVFRLRLCALVFIAAVAGFAQTLAPGGPGQDAQWLSAGKQAIGTSANLESKVWFTLANGVLTEVLYPNVQTANVQMLQFVVVNPKTKKIETEWDDATSSIKSLSTSRSKNLSPLPGTYVGSYDSSSSSLVFQQTTSSKSGSWSIQKTFLTDPKNNSVVVLVSFNKTDPSLDLYLYYDPSIANSGMHDTAFTQGRSLISTEKEIVSALTCGRCTFSDTTNGFLGVNDGLTQLRRSGRIEQPYSRAENGNVVQVAKVTPVSMPSRSRPGMLFSLAFGKTSEEALRNAQDSLTRGFAAIHAEYQKGWLDYLDEIPKVDPKYQAQFNMAAMVVKALEDKGTRGGNVASLSVPWGGGGNANEGGNGYRMVWSRDLYHVFTAFLTIGDRAAAERALDFLFKIQQKDDGSFPQNSDLTGKQGWGSLQMDEVGYPLIMAWQLGKFDKETYEKHVKRAADFIVKNGPASPQERWEERPGYSPSTIAAEIAGLVCAADIAKRNGDEASAMIWLAAADDWARNIERWTATTTGKYGDGNYYLRITANGRPDAGEKVELNNNAGTFPEHEIVDAGFLELVRLGIKPADDPLIEKSLDVIDQLIKVETPNGPAFYRYNHDGYGEMDDGRKWNWDGKYTGKGRPWPLLSGERGQYELALHNVMFANSQVKNQVKGSKARPPDPVVRRGSGLPLISASYRLDQMLAFASESLMIPEQVWDSRTIPTNYDRRFVPELKFGEGTGSATPLAWSMAQFIRLATNLKAGRNLDTPQVVFERYKDGIPAKVNNFGGLDEEAIIPIKPGAVFPAERQTTAGTRVAVSINGKTRIVTAGSDGKAKIEFTMPAEPTVALVGVHAPDGATSFERVKIMGSPPVQKFTAEEIEKLRVATSSPLESNDGETVVFIYRGKAESVGIAGDMTGWSGGRIFMQRIGDDLFAYKTKFPPSARLEYKLIVDGKWDLDPANPNSIDNGVGGRNNVLEMPGRRFASPVSADLYQSADRTPNPGILEEFEIVSKNFGPRRIKVYLPNSYAASNERFGAIYFQDGTEYAKRATAPSIYENLLAAKKVKPFILVFIDPKDRMKEYWANDAWADFVANEVVPEIDSRYRTIASRDGRAVLGASLGGITSLHIGLRHPDKFARLGGQSSSFWVDNERVVKALEKLDASKMKFQFYLDDGTFEGVDDTQRVNVMLRGKGYKVRYVEGSTGHNWTAWRDRLADAFIALLN